jgi:plastocyanin
MRRIAGVLMALNLVASAGFADEKSDHLDHLRVMLGEMSQHGAVVAQPEAIDPQATVTINITASSFSFSPNLIQVNQGDVVTLAVSVPSNDASTIGHGVLMDTYVEGGLDVGRGKTQSVTFTATTPGTFAWVCTQPSCGTGHTSMFGQMVVKAATAPGPTVSSVVPNSGSTAGGTAVTITGSNFQTSGTTIVSFDTTPATNVKVTSSTTMTAVTPAHSQQTVGVRVTNPDGQVGTLPQGFTYVAVQPRHRSVRH